MPYVLPISLKFQKSQIRNSKKWAKVQTGQTPYFPKIGGDRPRTKTIFIRVPRTKISKGQVGTKAPQGGELDKVPHPQKL